MVEATPYATNIPYGGVPAIVRVEYDPSVLRISLNFHDQHVRVDVEFERVAGFRVLDEGQLSSFWSAPTRPKGWLWQVNAGGWLTLESTREDFLLQYTAVTTPQEFLVCGMDDCVSILTYASPRTHVVAP